MSLDTRDYAYLSKNAYTNYSREDIDRTTVNLNGHEYQIFDYMQNPGGFHATAYQRTEPPHDVVIAFRGTDPDFKHHTLTTIQDVATDAIMVADKANVQAHDAVSFAQKVMAKAEKQGIPSSEITVTGHSLGGTLAEIAAYKCHLHGQTFNAYGAADLGLGIPQGGSQVIDNVLAGDPVSGSSQHFGQRRTFATPADISGLQAAGYLDGRHGPMLALRAMRMADHGMDNFAPGHGASVLTPDNEARAHHYASAIDRFRADAAAVRGDLHRATALPSTPLWGVARTAEAVEAVSTLGQYAQSEATRAAHAIGHAAVRTGEAAEHAAQRTGHAVERAAAHTGTAIEHVAASLNQEGAALRHRVEGLLHRPSLEEATHPAHPLYLSARAGVHQVETERGIAHGEHSNRLAGALTVAALQQGMARIDQVQLSGDGERAFGVQGVAPFVDFNRVAVVETASAVRTPLAQCSALAEAAYPAWQQQVQQRQAEQAALMASPAQHHAQGFSR